MEGHFRSQRVAFIVDIDAFQRVFGDIVVQIVIGLDALAAFVECKTLPTET
jgi:hypothetical protein